MSLEVQTVEAIDDVPGLDTVHEVMEAHEDHYDTAWLLSSKGVNGSNGGAGLNGVRHMHADPSITNTIGHITR